jgi:hypothetical protein
LAKINQDRLVRERTDKSIAPGGVGHQDENEFLAFFLVRR